MLRFTLREIHGPVLDGLPVTAYLVGPDDRPTPGEVALRDGCLDCRPKAGRSVGLCVQYDAGPMGRLMLQTCLLPERRRPYDLVLELARHRIKTFIAKSEDWQMFELDPAHPAMRRWESARQTFWRALTTTDAEEAGRLAHEALLLAIEATERLALSHAEILLHLRFGSRPASSRTLGARVHPGRCSDALKEIVKRDFDLIAVPLSWAELEVEEGQYRWEPLDEWIGWAAREGVPVMLGPLLDFSRRALPQWMYVWQHDYNTCRDLVYEFVERVVNRYRGGVGIWNLASGLNVNDNFEFTAEQMLDLIRMSNLIARQARKGARTMIELAQPFGEHCAASRTSLYPLDFVTRMNHDGIQVDCLGVQLLVGRAGGGRATRDLMQLSDVLDRYLRLEMPVVVSAFGAPSGGADPAAGWWRHPWSPEQQARWMARIFAVAMSKPFVETMICADLYDHPGADVTSAGLISDAGQPKPAFHKLIGTRKRLRKPLGPLKTEPLSPRHA